MRNKKVVTVLSHIFVPMSVLLSDLVAARALAQNGNQFKDWNPASDEVRRTPKITCEDLRSLTGYEFSIITATVITATEGTPEHCRVSGQILPEIRFEVNLPASWNRRLYMFGNGGFAGEPFDVDDRAASRDRALKYGFAVAATDTGHDANAEPLATFATNRQKLVDYAFRAVHTTAESAKKLVRAYYGESQSRAYFDGCSTGGSPRLDRGARVQRMDSLAGPRKRPPGISALRRKFLSVHGLSRDGSQIRSRPFRLRQRPRTHGLDPSGAGRDRPSSFAVSEPWRQDRHVLRLG